MIPNGVDLSHTPYRDPSANEALTVMYIGSHGQANALSKILDAIALVDNMTQKDIVFRLVGDGPLKANLRQQARELGIESRVRFDPAVPKDAVPDVAAKADMFIANVRDLPLYRYGISLNKLFDYLGAGRPIIFAGSAANDPVAEAQAGISVAADDAVGMAEAIVKVAEMSRAERISIGKRGRAHVEAHYSYAQLSESLCNEILALIPDNHPQRYPEVSKSLKRPSPET